MKFEIIDEMVNIEVIATGKSIDELGKLNKRYGKGKWRKLKCITTIKRYDGYIGKAEIHWYEAHGIGRRGMKIKKYL